MKNGGGYRFAWSICNEMKHMRHYFGAVERTLGAYLAPICACCFAVRDGSRRIGRGRRVTGFALLFHYALFNNNYAQFALGERLGG